MEQKSQMHICFVCIQCTRFQMQLYPIESMSDTVWFMLWIPNLYTVYHMKISIENFHFILASCQKFQKTELKLILKRVPVASAM